MGTYWRNGTIYTMAEEGQTVEAVYTEHGIIRGAGSREEIERRFAGQIECEVDLGGGVMFPGFVDSHIHLIGHGETFMKLQLSGIRTKKELLKRVEEKAKHIPEGMWIVGEGWNENEWELSEALTRVDLDEVAPHHPVILRRVCRHVLVVNSHVLQETGIEEGTASPAGGVIEKNGDGLLNGIFKEQAQELILSTVPGATDAYLEQALTFAIEDAWRNGLTGCHTEDLSYYGSCERTLKAFRTVILEQKKRFKAHLLIHHAALDEWIETGKDVIPEGSPWIEFGAMKLFADGALGGRTALLSRPYADAPDTCGVAVHSDEELDRLVTMARTYGLAVATHVIGDGAAEKVLNVLEKYPCPAEKRDRLIHGQILRKELMHRMKKLPLIVDIQPSFVASDFPWVLERVGRADDLYLYAWKTLLDDDIPCAGGSDAPIEAISPLRGIHAAVTRTKSEHTDGEVYGSDERLSMYEAISLYTTGSAYASCHEGDRGQIREGYAADFTVLAKDPFVAEPDELLRNRVNMTIIDGEIVYESKEA